MWVLDKKILTAIGEDRIFDISSFDVVQKLGFIELLEVNHIGNVLGSICQFETIIDRHFELMFRVCQKHSHMFGLINTDNFPFQKCVLKWIWTVRIRLDPNSSASIYVSKYLFISIFLPKIHSCSFIFYYI
jgi:hypothetical protein